MMRKYLRTAGFALLLLLLASAGAFGTPKIEAEYPTSDDGKTEVVFWTHGRHDLAFVQDQVDRYNATNTDNTFVILESHTESITEELHLAFESGQAPAIFSRVQAIDEYAKLGRLADMMPLLSAETIDRYESWFQPGRGLRVGPNGDLILTTIPRGFTTTYRFIWNKDLFEAAGLDPESPPASFDELVEYSKIITEYGATQDPQKYGFAWPGVEGDVWEYWIFNPLTDSGLYFFDYDKMEYNFSQYQPVLEAYAQMVTDGSLFPGVLQLSWDPPRAQFAEGNIGMYFAASWDVGVLTEQFPAQIDWGVGPNPTLTGEKVGQTVVGGGWNSFYVNGEAHEVTQQAAVRFLEFMMSLDEQVKYYEGGYGIPALADITAAATPPSDPHVAGFAAVDDVVFPRWPPPVQLEGENAYEVFNNIIFGRVDAAEALADLDARMAAGLQETWDLGERKAEDYRLPGWTPPKSKL